MAVRPAPRLDPWRHRLPDHPRDGRYWCRDWVGNMLMMSSYHLSNETIGRKESIVTQPDGRIIARLDRIFQGHDRHLVEGHTAATANSCCAS